MKIERFTDPEEFLTRTVNFRAQNEITTQMIGRAAQAFLNGRGAQYEYANWWIVQSDTDEVIGLMMHTSPLNLVLSDMPENAIPSCVDAVLRDDPDFSGVNAPQHLARIFIEILQAKETQNIRFSLAISLHSYVIGKLIEPNYSHGNARIADEQDFEIVRKWRQAFITETEIDTVDNDEVTRKAIESKRIYIWESDGTPVSMASFTPFVETPASKITSIGGVYTPPDQRKKGFASSIVSFLSDFLMNQGLRVMLYTDAKNPTSNKIYTDLGFEYVQTNDNWNRDK